MRRNFVTLTRTNMSRTLTDIVRGAIRAVLPSSSSALSQQAGQRPPEMPQSQPMERNIELLLSTLFPSSDKLSPFSSKVRIDTSGASASPYAAIEGRHSPLEADDERLLGMPHLPMFATRFSRDRCWSGIDINFRNSPFVLSIRSHMQYGFALRLCGEQPTFFSNFSNHFKNSVLFCLTSSVEMRSRNRIVEGFAP